MDSLLRLGDEYSGGDLVSDDVIAGGVVLILPLLDLYEDCVIAVVVWVLEPIDGKSQILLCAPVEVHAVLEKA